MTSKNKIVSSILKRKRLLHFRLSLLYLLIALTTRLMMYTTAFRLIRRTFTVLRKSSGLKPYKISDRQVHQIWQVLRGLDIDCFCEICEENFKGIFEGEFICWDCIENLKVPEL